MQNTSRTGLAITCALLASSICGIAAPVFRAVEIDADIKIGYGLACADVDGDGRIDVLLADKERFVWYRNPDWKPILLTGKLTPKDHVCIAASDVDGDGKCEVAVGAEWNPGDTMNSGAVFYLEPQTDRTQPWKPIALPHEPTVHRMRWAKDADDMPLLVMVPLHGRGNKNAVGAGVKVLAYRKPADVSQPWATRTINDMLHATHNFDIQPDGSILLGGREGILTLDKPAAEYAASWLVRGANAGESVPAGTAAEPECPGVGELRAGRGKDGSRYVAAIEPMHGNFLAVYTSKPGDAKPTRTVLTDALADGHALACGDLLGTGSDQIVVGWRAMNRPGVRVGMRLWEPITDASTGATSWKEHVIDDNTMACEDLMLADFDGDGDLDIVAAGRATHNVKLYFNETPKTR